MSGKHAAIDFMQRWQREIHSPLPTFAVHCERSAGDNEGIIERAIYFPRGENNAVTENTGVHFGIEKAPQRIGRGFYDRLTCYVEGGVQQNGNPGPFFELGKQTVKFRRGFLGNRLHAASAVHVNHRRHTESLLRTEWQYTKHERTGAIGAFHIKPVINVFLQNHRRERPEAFTELHALVQDVLHLRLPGIAENASLSQSAWTHFGAVLEPSDNLALREQVGRLFQDTRTARTNLPRQLPHRGRYLRFAVRPAHVVQLLAFPLRVTAKLPKSIVSGANGGAAVFRSGHNEDIAEAALPDDPLVGYAV